jgi:hypothetical protein
LSLGHFCHSQDVRLYLESIEIEAAYCAKIKHHLELTKFINTVKPFVCLNYDQHRGFTLVRQDKCDKHQANPLLTGQLLFGIVAVNNPGGTPANQGTQQQRAA